MVDMLLVIKANLGTVNLAPSTEPDQDDVEKLNSKFVEDEEEETCL